MYPDSDNCSFLLMSNSDIFLVSDQQKKQPQFPDSETHDPPPPPAEDFREEDDRKGDDKQKEDEAKDEDRENSHSDVKEKTAISSEKEEPTEVDDNDEGFLTPTSPGSKIPEVTRCPGAPRKPWQKLSAKRKQPSSSSSSSPPEALRSLSPGPLDPAVDIESLFPPTGQDDVVRKIKKARKHEDDDSE